MTFLRYFLYIVGGALASAALGGLFAAAVALLSPEFVKGFFFPSEGASMMRYAAAIGMIWGVFLGTAVMAFSLLLVTAIHVANLFRKGPGDQGSR